MLLELIEPEASGVRFRIAYAALLAGVANASMVVVLRLAVRSSEELNIGIFVLFWASYLLQILSLRRLTITFSQVCESALHKVRCRIVDKVRHAELQGIEAIGSAEIYTLVTNTTTMISYSIWPVISALNAIVMLAFTSFYVMYLSRAAFLCMLLIYGGGGFAFYQRRKKIRIILIQAARQQLALFGVLTDLLRGGKEVRLHAQRSDEVVAQVHEMAATLQHAPIQNNRILLQNFLIARGFLFVLLTAIVFVVPMLVPWKPNEVNSLIAVAIFMFEPLTTLLRAIPEYERADLAAANLLRMEQRLEQTATPTPAVQKDPWGGRFSELQVANLCFHHTDPAGGASFSLGPVSFTLRAGEIVFIVGGNGSGKTTLLKLLTTLYAPTSGSLILDQTPIGPENLTAYRELITAIFAEFHLFKKLYGLSDISAEAVQGQLQQMQMVGTTGYKDGAFTRLELSTGQRKRLAMVVALLEDRPLYVFDEWAADQDPEFRRYYYEELLPALKRQGKTVLAISHDDRYFHCADRVITMEYGAVRSIARHALPPGPPPARPEL